MAATELAQAIEVFARAFAYARSFTFAARAKPVAGLWVIRDQPRKRAADYRREEWVALKTAPDKVDAVARRHTRGRFCICAVRSIDEPDDAIRAGYRALGYRLGATESFMVHRLKPISRYLQPFPVVRVATWELADRWNKAAGRKLILPEHLIGGSPLRAYVALDGERPVGWVRTNLVGVTALTPAGTNANTSAGDASWVSMMYVIPAYRRKGVGKSILQTMLRDDRKLGSACSVLLASHAGEHLYNSVGYEKIGQLLIYTPPKSKR